MPELHRLAHIKFDSFFEHRAYTYPRVIAAEFPLAQRNRATHGNSLMNQLRDIRDHYRITQDVPLPQNMFRDNAIYVEFFSEYNYGLKFESLSQENNDDPDYQILNITQESRPGSNDKRFRVVVMMKEGGISKFIRKISEYIRENVKRNGIETDKPKNQALVDNIASIQLASLESFWSDSPEFPFPPVDEVTWYEVWFRKTNSDTLKLEQVLTNLRSVGVQISDLTLEFPEHRVRLVKASARQLSSSLLLLDNLAELRKPQQINNFVYGKNIDFATQREWLEDLISRVDANIDENSVIITILDSGINNRHPLIHPFLPDERLFTYKNDWGTNDTWGGGGHGTGMGGIALFGNLTEVLSSPERVQVFHGLESFKIVHPPDPNEPSIYGSLTEYACSLPYVNFPNNARIFCLSITDSDIPYFGRPSSWSSAIDKICFGNIYDPKLPQLFIISSGNVDYLNSGARAQDYPEKNETESIHDPAQSHNAIVVGSYTRMDRIDVHQWPGHNILAPLGGMSPSNSTSLMWRNQWPIKPDIVLEGGNLAFNNFGILDIPVLKPLSLDKEFTRYLFMPFGDTSAAAALASKMCAEIMHTYPRLWVETIRGLIIHSAEWTDQMLNGLRLANTSQTAKRTLLRKFGYGVPNLKNALYSAENSLTLIAENTIRPYRLQNGNVRYNEFHLYSIPWPAEVLQNELYDINVTLKVTLSYFIEPNPGNKRFVNNFPYHSHALDFKVIKPAETIDEFKRRVSANVEGDADVNYDGGEEPWTLKESIRNKGSIKKDFITTSGADLATRNFLAIYPKSGWYKTKKKLEKYNADVRYSLIVSIETATDEINIYTPVLNQVGIPIPITI